MTRDLPGSGWLPSLFLWLAGLVLFIAMSPVSLAQQPPPTDPIAVPNPATDLWRNVRARQDAEVLDPGLRQVRPTQLAQDLWLEVQRAQSDIAGSTQVRGIDAGVLINTQGEQWRQYRMTQLVPLAIYAIGGMLVLIAAFRLLRGKIRIGAGRSKYRMPRFSLVQRYAHWTVAITFVILGLTGVILTLGRQLLLPWMGPEVFGPFAFGAKRIHDFVGPVFGVALLIQFFLFVRGNGPSLKEDLMWILKGGGLLGGHASSHRYNAGEKSWFWLAMLGGLVVVISGLVLNFPNFGQDREMMSLAHVVHSVAAILILAASLGHIYMGTIAMEGAFEVMATGYCDANWAKEHHDLWYEDMAAQGKLEPVPDGRQPESAASMDEAMSRA